MSTASALRSFLSVLGFAFAVSFSPVVAQTTDSTAADGFDPNVDGPVYALVTQPDGKVLIAGLFKTLAPNGGPTIGDGNTQKNIARVQADGRLDGSFNANVNGQINAMVLQPDGKVLIGGSFTSVNGSPATYTAGQSHLRIARLNADGTTDATFNGNIQPAGPDLSTSLTPEVRAIALQSDGKVLVGGGFVQNADGTAGAAIQRLMRLNDDGSVDPTFTLANPDNAVLAIKQQANGRILIGGAFKNLLVAGGSVARNCVARLNLDGSVDGSFIVSANRSVFVIETQADDYILIGGDFDAFTQASALAAGTAAASAGRLVRVDPNGNFGSGGKAFYASFDGPVRAVKVQPDGRIVVAGAFNTARDLTRRFVARTLPNGFTDGSFIAFPNFAVDALALQPNGNVVVGGAFTTIAGTATNPFLRNHVARLTTQGFADATFRPEASGRIRSLTVLSRTARKRILVGGTFTAIAGETHNGVAAMNPDGTLDRTFTLDPNGPVLAAVEQEDGKILIAGAFTRVNGINRAYVARLNADYSLDVAFNPAPNGQVNAIAVDGSSIYLGGNFSGLAPLGSTTTYAQPYIAKLKADGSLDTGFYPRFNNSVQTIVLQSDHKLLVGGSFTSVTGTNETTTVNRYGGARLEANGTVEATFHPNIGGVIYAMLPQSDGSVVVAGSFTQTVPDFTNLKDRWNILRIKPDGSLDDAFDPRPNATVYSLAQLSDGSILLGGLFTTFRPKGGELLPVDYTYAAKLSATGEVDTNFRLTIDQLAGNEVVAVAASPTDGRALIAGAFTSVSAGGTTVARNRLVQVTNAGAVDTAFNPDVGSATGSAIEALTLLSDESILAAGSFSGLNGTTTSGLARFYVDGAPVTNFVPNIRGTVHAIGQFVTKGEPVSTQRKGFAWLETNGQLRSTYVPGADPAVFGSVTAMALEPAGTVIVGGSFNTGGAADALARFKPDGSIDGAFLPRVNGTISAIAVQSDGKILIGGTFDTIATVTRYNLARLNANGSLDTAFNPFPNGAVTGIVIQSDGKIVICGGFSTLAPNGATAATTRYSIARLNADGTLDTAFDPNPNNTVAAVAVLPNGKILAGGSFTAFRPNATTTSTERSYLALLNADGTVDATDFKPNSTVTRLLVQNDGKALVAGSFTSLHGQPRNYFGRLNADLTLDEGFNPNPNGMIFTMATDGEGRIVIGGGFTALQPNSSSYDAAIATPRYRAARLNANGTIDNSFNPNFDSALSVVLVASDNSVIAAGAFTSVQPSGSLLVGGSFTEVNSVKVNHLAMLGGDGSVSAAFLPEPNAPVFAVLTLPDGRAVVGGSFTTISGNTRNRLARFNANDTFDSSFNPNANGDVYTLARQPDGKIIVGGAFTTIGGQARNYLARLNADGSLDGSFSAAAPAAVRSVALQSDGKVLYVADGASSGQNVLDRVNSDGSADGSFAARLTGLVNAIAVQADGYIVVGGKFTSIGGADRTNLARLKPNGDADPTITSKPSGAVTCVTVQLDGKILLGGTFSTVDGEPRFGLARIATAVAPTMSFTATEDRSTIVWSRGGAQPEVSAVEFERSADYNTWTELGQGTRIPGTANWQLSGVSLPVGEAIYIRATATVPVSPNSSSGLVHAFGAIGASNVPVIGGGTLVSATTGSAFNYTIVASGSPTGYSADGLPAGLTVNTTTGLISGTPTQTGTFNVAITAKNASGSTTKTLVIVVAAPGQSDTTTRVINLSVLAQVSPAKPIVAGFVIRGGSALNLLVRGVGPTLGTLQVASPLATPNLKIYDGHNLQLKETNSWGNDPTVIAEGARLGATPLGAGSADAAILVTLNPGAYTVHITGPNDTSGMALAELYDASPVPAPANSPRLVNISARGDVIKPPPGSTAAEQIITAGFVVTGTTPKRILIRGVGPGLLSQGVTNVLVDPVLTLNHRVNGVMTVEAQNNDWGTPVNSVYAGKTAAEIAAAASTAGAFTLSAGSRDAAILVDLPPGIYSAQVASAVDTAAAGAMVEVYEVQ